MRRAGPAQQQGGEFVEVSATAAYGTKRSSKAVISAVIAAGIGLGCLVMIYLIVTSLSDDHLVEAKKQKEEVQDPRAFERSIDQSVERVRKMLKSDASHEVRETSDFSDVLELIQLSGGTSPAWESPPRPGQPFKSFGFVISGKHENTGQPDAGFLMLLYYKTAAEVDQAGRTISDQIGGNKNFSLKVNTDLWYVAYSGNPFGGKIHNNLEMARNLGEPANFTQFTDRVGSTHKGRAIKR